VDKNVDHPIHRFLIAAAGDGREFVVVPSRGVNRESPVGEQQQVVLERQSGVAVNRQGRGFNRAIAA
jgi:hypothetical protein